MSKIARGFKSGINTVIAGGQLVITRSILVWAIIDNPTNALRQAVPFKFQNEIQDWEIVGLETYHAALLANVPTGESVISVADCANVVLTVTEQNKSRQIIQQQPYNRFIASNYKGTSFAIVPFNIDITKTFIKLMATGTIQNNTAVPMVLYYTRQEDAKRLKEFAAGVRVC